MKLIGYWRSSAAWRVRIGLNLKGVAVDHEFRNLRAGEHKSAAYRGLNPQGLVPSLVTDDGQALTQSLAILEWLEERYPEPALLPGGADQRAAVRSLAQVIACDIHPINNLRVLAYLRELGFDEAAVAKWVQHWIASGFEAAEQLVSGSSGPYCFGDQVTLADLCLVPQMYGARRFGSDLSPYPRLVAIDAALAELPAFAEAHAERQPDAVAGV
jgi:maleylacetoacetate isomerase